MKENTITSINSFSSLFKKIRKSNKKYVFRGQKEDWVLLPKVARENMFSLVDEPKMLDEFKQKTAPYFVGNNIEKMSVPEHDFDWYILAQHFGLRTRCLDWTDRFEIALFFATKGSMDKDGVIWMYELPEDYSTRWLPLGHKDVLEKRPFDFEENKLYHQKSFLNIRPDNQYGIGDLRSYPWKPMEEREKGLAKVFIYAKDKSMITSDLNNRGINHTYIFGEETETHKDIENICEEINSKYKRVLI